MKKIINFIESNLVGAQIQQSNTFTNKSVKLDENTALVCAYGNEKFIRGYIAIKHEGANSIPEDSRQWHQSPNISTIISISRSGSIEIKNYDYEKNTRESNLAYDIYDDGNVEISKFDETTEYYEPFGNTTSDAILEALQQKEYSKIISGDIKTSTKQI